MFYKKNIVFIIFLLNSTFSLAITEDLFTKQIIEAEYLENKYKYEEANKIYSDLYLKLNTQDKLLQPEIKQLIMIYYRLILSYYKISKYKQCAIHTFEFIISKYKYTVEYDNFITTTDVIKMINAGSISLYEYNDINFIKELIKHPMSNGLGKKIIIQVINEYVKHKKYEEAENIILFAENYFFSTKEIIDLYESLFYLILEENNEEKITKYSTLISEKLFINSIWKSTLELTLEEEAKRQNLFLKSALIATDYLYKLGEKTQNTEYYLKASLIYSYLSEENTDINNKADHLIKASKMAILAKDYEYAKKLAKKSLIYSVNTEKSNSSYFLLIKALYYLTENVKHKNDDLYIEYEQAVNNYINNYPSDINARNNLFMSAKRDELFNDFINAKIKLEKLLKFVSYLNNDERVKILKSLALINAKIPQATEALENYIILEQQAKEFKLEKNTLNFIANANVAKIKSYAHELKLSGKLNENADALFFWVKQNMNNNEAHIILKQSINDYIELAEWEKAEQALFIFFSNFNQSIFLPEIKFFAAKVCDMQLNFLCAAKFYMESAIQNNKSLSIEEEFLALSKAELIYRELKQIDKSALLLANMANIKMLQKNTYEEIKLKIRAGYFYLAVSNYDEALQNFSQVINKTKKTLNLQLEAELGLIEANFNRQFYKDKIKTIDNFIAKILKILKKHNEYNLLHIIDRALKAAFNEDSEEINNLKQKKINLQILDNIKYIADNMSKRIKNANIYLNNSTLAFAINIEADTRLYISDNYNEYIKNNVIFNNFENTLLQKSLVQNKYSEELLFSGLSRQFNNLQLRINMLEKYKKFNFNKFELNFPFPDLIFENNYIEQYLKLQKKQHDIKNNLYYEAIDLFLSKKYFQSMKNIVDMYQNIDYFKKNLSENEKKELDNITLFLSIIYIKTGLNNNAIVLLDKLIKENPTWDIPYFVLTEYYLTNNSYYLAEKVINTGIDKTNLTHNIYIIKIFVLLKQNKHELAFKTLDSAMQKFPNTLELKIWQNILEYKYMKDKQKYCTNIVELSNQISDFNLNWYKIECLINSYNFEEAEKKFLTIELEYANNENLTFLGAFLYDKINKKNKMNEYLLKYLSLNPANQELKYFAQYILKNSDFYLR